MRDLSNVSKTAETLAFALAREGPMKLYYVRTIVKEGRKNVRLKWFHRYGGNLLDGTEHRPECAAEELFTAAEARVLKCFNRPPL
jgi:uncharacterized metal-binding protein